MVPCSVPTCSQSSRANVVQQSHELILDWSLRWASTAALDGLWFCPAINEMLSVSFDKHWWTLNHSTTEASVVVQAVDADQSWTCWSDADVFPFVVCIVVKTCGSRTTSKCGSLDGREPSATNYRQASGQPCPPHRGAAIGAAVVDVHEAAGTRWKTRLILPDPTGISVCRIAEACFGIGWLLYSVVSSAC